MTVERDAEKARADAAEAKVRAVEDVRAEMRLWGPDWATWAALVAENHRLAALAEQQEVSP